jgi:hypothetical protein
MLNEVELSGGQGVGGSNPLAPTNNSIENKDVFQALKSVAPVQMRTNWRRNAAIGTKSPEIVPKSVRQTFANELREIARAVRRIGDPFRADPETLCIQKDEISRRLIAVAVLVERAA